MVYKKGGKTTQKIKDRDMEASKVMEQMGNSIDFDHKNDAYKLLDNIGVKNSAKRYECVERVSYHLERDEPFLAMKVASDFIDKSSTYRLFAVLLIPKPSFSLFPI